MCTDQNAQFQNIREEPAAVTITGRWWYAKDCCNLCPIWLGSFCWDPVALEGVLFLVDGCFCVVQPDVSLLQHALEVIQVFGVALFCLSLSVSTSNHCNVVCDTNDSFQPTQCLGKVFLETLIAYCVILCG